MRLPSHRLLPFLLLISIAPLTARPTLAQSDTRSELERLRSDASVSADEQIQRLYDIIWTWRLEASPELATYVGIRDYNDRWSDLSEENIEHLEEMERLFQASLQVIDRSALSPDRQLDYDLLATELKTTVGSQVFPTEYLLINQMSGVQQDIPQYLMLMPAQNLRDFSDRIARLRAIPNLIDQHMSLLRKGLEQGITPPRITLRDVPEQIRSLLTPNAEESPLLASFERTPSTMDEATADSLRSAAVEVVRDEVYPAYQALLAFIEDEYIPGSREAIALADLPDGPDWYRFNVAMHTTTDLSPREVHEIGLREVDRIRSEMEQILVETGFEGDLHAFFDYLRTNPEFFFDSPDALLRAYRDIAKRADPELIRLFGTLPRLGYGVEPVPSYAEKSQTTAYYQPGSIRGARPGIFYANTYDLASRPSWEMEALTLHEAVPGHHLQISLADELEGVHDLRKSTFYTAFVEGWGLYAESLGSEMGFYVDPYARFGQLTYEMWRAVRLVVDTGMHSLGWSRQEAIDYFKANAPKTEHDIIVEIDRYIVWPGQALAYKIGELKIKELRDYARQSLGDSFDIRAFHDRVLESGALPMNVLEERIQAWVREQIDGA